MLRHCPTSVFVALVMLLAAGASGDSVTRVNKGNNPPLESESEVGTGDVLFAQFERSEVELARLKSDVRVSQSGKALPKDGATEIVYQGARVQILDANSNGAKYKVLSGFRSAEPAEAN
jgi:hypothetical protein